MLDVVAEMTGVSTPLTNGHKNHVSMADRFHTLMTEDLGHEKYAVCGSDYGAQVAAQLAHRYPEQVIGVRLGMPSELPAFQGDRYGDSTGARQAPEDASPELRADFKWYDETLVSHVVVACLDAQTATHGLNDSPAGLLAWLLERWTHPAITVPTSFSLHLGDSASPGINTPEQYEALLRQIGAHIYADLRDVNVRDKGGHFGQWGDPDAWVDDLRRAFRPLR
ncbi:alpha/beta hydrolase [Streptomyces sp. E11-3]|uniref:alpha/beta fold hydrolase n=1 Tax=Streptomyces sp. E11-3 TaxID=3110112 RepID=UPI003980C40B